MPKSVAIVVVPVDLIKAQTSHSTVFHMSRQGSAGCPVTAGAQAQPRPWVQVRAFGLLPACGMLYRTDYGSRARRFVAGWWLAVLADEVM